MKGIALHIILLLLYCIGCEKDATILPKPYPYVIMKEVNSNENDVEFIAEVQDIGSFPIVSYGFVWSEQSNPELDVSYSKEMDQEFRLGEYTLWVTSDLKKDELYTVRPYVKTDKHIVYGNSMSFQSEGSKLPVLNYFEPKSGNSGDTILVYGRNFSVLKSRIEILVGTDAAEVISTDFEIIKCVLPQHLSRSGEVPLFVKSGENLVQANEPFLINGHRINDFSPKEGIIGETEVEISGTGFNSSELAVWFDDGKAEILHANDTIIKVKLPYVMLSGNVKIKVDINGKMAVSDGTFRSKSRWFRLNNFPGIPRVFGSLTVIDNFCYLLNGTEDHAYWDGGLKDFWRYNLTTDQWEQLQDFPGVKRSRGIAFAINGILYYGLGVNGFSIQRDFWKFDPRTNIWTKLSDFPVDRLYDLIHFTLNGKGYVLHGNESGTTDVWQYEHNIDKWTLLGQIMDLGPLDARDAFFQSNDKAYIIPITYGFPTRHILHEFIPEVNSFIRSKTVALPETLFGDRLPAFILDGQMYLLGYVSDFWKYDFSLQQWTRLENFPGGNRLFTSFMSNGSIGYLLFGSLLGYSNASPDIWLYNPNSSK